MTSKQLKIEGSVLFREIQQFRVQWVWWLLISVVFFSVGITFAASFMEGANRQTSLIALALVIPLETVMLYLFYIVKFETVVTPAGVYYCWRPFFRKYSLIPAAELRETNVRDCPRFQYGYHYVPGYGSVHSLANGKGIQFRLLNGRKIFVGTQKINNFQSAVAQLQTDQPYKMQTGG